MIITPLLLPLMAMLSAMPCHYAAAIYYMIMPMAMLMPMLPLFRHAAIADYYAMMSDVVIAMPCR